MELPDEFADIGNGHAISIREEGGTVFGVWVRHECAIKDHHGKHGAYIPLVGPNAWTMVQREPLTITPSIHVTDCGDHGFITNGRWVKA
jgi:hypothetical protein